MTEQACCSASASMLQRKCLAPAPQQRLRRLAQVWRGGRAAREEAESALSPFTARLQALQTQLAEQQAAAAEREQDLKAKAKEALRRYKLVKTKLQQGQRQQQQKQPPGAGAAAADAAAASSEVSE